MRLGTVTACALLVCLSAELRAQPPAPEKPVPTIAVAEPTASWGRIIQGQEFRHRFEIRNTGEAPLEIRKVKSSCGCATVEFDRLIAPGAEGGLVVLLKSDGLVGEAVRKSVEIFTNDPTTPSTKVWIEGDVLPVLVTDPSPLLLRSFPGEPLVTRAILSPGSPLTFEIQKITARNQRVQIECEKEEEGPGYRLVLRAETRSRVFRDRDVLDLELVTSDGRQRRVELICAVDVQDPVAVHPARNLVFTRKETRALRATPPRVVPHEVLLESRQEGHRFRVLEAVVEKAPPETFEVKIETVEDGQKYKVVVTALKHLNYPSVRCRLRIQTDNSANPTYRLNVLAQFKVMKKKP